MRSQLVFNAVVNVANRYELVNLVARAARALHRPGTRIQDAMNNVVVRCSGTYVASDLQASSGPMAVARRRKRPTSHYEKPANLDRRSDNHSAETPTEPRAALTETFSSGDLFWRLSAQHRGADTSSKKYLEIAVKRSRYKDVKRMRYATADDFKKIFNEEMRSLFLLCLQLTADIDKAEHCFVTGLEQCMSESCSFREWARHWARRIVIKKAIQLMRPARQSSMKPASGCFNRLTADGMNSTLRDLMELDTLERFVIVITIIERYSDQDSALLLGCRRIDIAVTRAMALRKMSRRAVGERQTQEIDKARQSMWPGPRIEAIAAALEQQAW